MISGNPDPNLQLKSYRDNAEAIELVHRFLEVLAHSTAQ
jgi:hypothetical protein